MYLINILFYLKYYIVSKCYISYFRKIQRARNGKEYSIPQPISGERSICLTWRTLLKIVWIVRNASPLGFSYTLGVGTTWIWKLLGSKLVHTRAWVAQRGFKYCFFKLFFRYLISHYTFFVCSIMLIKQWTALATGKGSHCMYTTTFPPEKF